MTKNNKNMFTKKRLCYIILRKVLEKQNYIDFEGNGNNIWRE